MTLTAYRIVKRKHARTAFTGLGAKRYGGRWHEPGTAVVYTAASASLAMLEMLVHLDAEELLDWYAIFAVTFDSTDVTCLSADELPASWRRESPTRATRAVGTAWAAAGSTAVLRVPSVIVPDEFNYILNPAHPRFAAVRIGPRRDFRFDRRLARGTHRP